MNIENQEETTARNRNSRNYGVVRRLEPPNSVNARNTNGVANNVVGRVAGNRNGDVEEFVFGSGNPNRSNYSRTNEYMNMILGEPHVVTFDSDGEISENDEYTNAVPIIGREEVVDYNVLDEMQAEGVGARGGGARGGGERRRRQVIEIPRAEERSDFNGTLMPAYIEYHDNWDDVGIYMEQISPDNNIADMDAEVHREIDGIMRSGMRHEFMHRMRRALFSMENRRRRLPLPISDDAPQRANSGIDETEEGNGDVPIEPENPIRFDTNLPAEHSYLGSNMNRVSGVNYLDVGQKYRIMLFMHSRIVLPGEVFPFIIPASFLEGDIDAQNGLMLGICFPHLLQEDSNGYNIIYGVTCQIYEKGFDGRTSAMVKSRALQRFVTSKIGLSGPLQQIASTPQYKCFGYVKILPEIYLPSPLNCINMGSMNRFRGSTYMKDTFKRYQAATTPWPAHVYDYYSIEACLEQARELLAQHKIENMPANPIQLSFWLVRNLHFKDSVIKDVFLTDSVNTRMKLMSSALKEDTTFTCRFCANPIAKCSELFAMNKHGVQTQYCNSSGYIHETNTVYNILGDAVSYSGNYSSEFSWFPGYKWHIIVCRICSRHIGWEFKATEPNLVPKKFYGISSYSVRVSNTPTDSTTDPRAVIYRSFMRLARREMQ